MSKKVKLGAASVRGIDVSHYQGKIDFKKVRADGYQFVFVKASDGETSKDSTYSYDSNEARLNGLVVGAYHFFRFTKDPIKQMDNLIATIGAHKAGDLPPTLDVEWSEGYKTVTPGGAAVALKALAYLKKKLGVTPIVYTSAAFLTDCTAAQAIEFAQYTLWVASYRTDYAIIPDCWDNFRFWQQTDKAKSLGVTEGGLDGDVFNGTMAQLMMLTGFVVKPITVPPSVTIPITPPPVDPAPVPVAAQPNFFQKLWAKIKELL